MHAIADVFFLLAGLVMGTAAGRFWAWANYEKKKAKRGVHT